MTMSCAPCVRLMEPAASVLPWKLLLFTTNTPSIQINDPSSLRVEKLNVPAEGATNLPRQTPMTLSAAVAPTEPNGAVVPNAVLLKSTLPMKFVKPAFGAARVSGVDVLNSALKADK